MPFFTEQDLLVMLLIFEKMRTNNYFKFLIFFSLIFSFSFDHVLAEYVGRRYVDCNLSDCDPKYPNTSTEYYKSNGNALLLQLPGGHGSFQIFLSSRPISDLDNKVDVVFLINPYPMPNPNGDPPLRYSPDYVARIKSVIEYYKKLTNKKIWLSGHSAGTPGIAGFLNRDKNNYKIIDGAVFLSSNYYTRVKVDKINVPILILHHEWDRCRSNKYSGAQILNNKFLKINSSKTKFVTFSGGKAFGDPCDSPGGYHFFVGQNDKVANEIINFINENNK